LRDLIHANPATRFDLFHASYPWCDDVLGLAHKYPNVWVDLCWLPLISTARAIAFLREVLELINGGRLLWGCDTWTSEESLGARYAVHHCIRQVLNGMIEEDLLDRDTALTCFNFDLFGEDVVRCGKKEPRVEFESENYRLETLIGPEDTPCFSMSRHSLHGCSVALQEDTSIWICVEGEGVVTCGDWERPVRQGDYFFLPAAATDNCRFFAPENAKIVCCKGGQ
jgi:mannose-6-phosphate isomerase-like protein (cupin superfamily)